MKKLCITIGCITSVLLFFLADCTMETASGPTPYGLTTVKVSFVDSLEKATSLPDSLQKAASLLDTLQKAYSGMKFGMFFHFNMSTFDRYTVYSVSGEWG
jgi:hypothetical protein